MPRTSLFSTYADRRRVDRVVHSMDEDPPPADGNWRFERENGDIEGARFVSAADLLEHVEWSDDGADVTAVARGVGELIVLAGQALKAAAELNAALTALARLELAGSRWATGNMAERIEGYATGAREVLGLGERRSLVPVFDRSIPIEQYKFDALRGLTDSDGGPALVAEMVAESLSISESSPRKFRHDRRRRRRAAVCDFCASPLSGSDCIRCCAGVTRTRSP